MSDFAQSGLIATLQQLNPPHLATLESGLAGIQPRIALILPCHGADLERPAFAHIVGELERAHFVDQIILCTNQAAPQLLEKAFTLLRPLPARVRVLQSDSTGAPHLLSAVPGANSPPQPGKGLNVWIGIGLLVSEGHQGLVALQDCDVSSFRREDLARLCFACAHPDLRYRFAKMYYDRATDRLYGRVSRLFFAPLLQTIVRLFGHHPLTDFLLSFRYPLAGECAMDIGLAATLPLATGWGLETAMLSDVFRQADPRQVAQVESGTSYDHKHQPAAGALEKMCAQIASTLCMELASEGVAASPKALQTAYLREAAVALRRSAHLACINGMPHDPIAEQQLVNRFLGTLENTIPALQKLPPWTVVEKKAPQLLHGLSSLVRFDSAGAERPTRAPA